MATSEVAGCDERNLETWVPVLEALATEACTLADRRLVDADIEPELKEYLAEYCRGLQSAQRRLQVGPINACSGIFLAALMAAGKEPTTADLEMASGWELFKLSLCLFDAVEDEELLPSFRRWGCAVPVNAALVLFTLANDAIGAACDRLAEERRSAFRKKYTGYCLHVGSAQHRDLRKWRPGGEQPAVEQATAKCTLYVMLLELAAVVAGRDEMACARYRAAGEGLALLFQVSNDLRDMFGASGAADLACERWTLPVHIFHARASLREVERLRELLPELPGSLEEVQRLFVSSGALAHLALLMDQARGRVHDAIAAVGGSQGPLALLGDTADAHANRVVLGNRGATGARSRGVRT